MAKILGLDLGTNSIGWTIRDTESENQIIDYGVVVFEKGVGDGKSGEFSLAAERRKHRSKRRLYNAKRYRKWALLKILIEENMCPLSMEELRLWSVGEWVKIEENGTKKWKNLGRKYPINNEEWRKWLAMDPSYFGDNGMSKKNKPIRKSPYDLRSELIVKFEENEQLRKYKIGRALYHLAQRRGFKTSRKSGKSTYAENKVIEEKKKENTNYHIANVALDAFKSGQRFRASGVIQRKYYEEEFLAICKNQNLDDVLTKKLFDAVYTVRPLRTQKGLVGKCTLEKRKHRIPISHPAFEEFRALSFINNIQWRKSGTSNSFESIPMKLKKEILEKLFFRRFESGKNKGKVDDRTTFKFEEIIDIFSENGKWEFNYRNKPNVPNCPVIAGLMNVFDNEWKDKFITDENKFGINWEGLFLSYTVKYGNENKKGKERKLNYEGIWHLLFDYIQTKDNEDGLKKFCKEVLKWDDKKIETFTEISIKQGYGSLSKNAISKIIPYLQEGHIYSESVLYANLSKVLGKENFSAKKEEIKKAISETIKEVDKEKEKFNIINGLIQKYFGENKPPYKSKGVDDKIREVAKKEVLEKLKSYFGTIQWEKKTENEKKEYYDFVLEKYIRFLDGKQSTEEKASSQVGKTLPKDALDYYKLPRLDEAIKQVLKEKFGATEEELIHLYHPSDIYIYPKSKKYFLKFLNNNDEKEDIKLTQEEWNIVKNWCKENPNADIFTDNAEKIHGKRIQRIPQLESPEPPSKGWKNTMAMRTMYQLKKLVNYLLQVGKIDEETKIVIEMARELNDANKRKAIEYWQKDREKENEEYAATITEMLNGKTLSDDDYNKFRAAVEQLIVKEFSENDKNKYNDFIETFLIKKNKRNKDKSDDSKEDEEETTETISNDYLLYLILYREEFVRLLMDQPIGAGRILNVAGDFKNKRKAIKEMLTKYRLWKEQKFQCFYTGRQISFTELFDPTKCQIEHTIPRSISFDSELKNLTVCDAVYNNDVKDNSFPTECPNYFKSQVCKTSVGDIECNPIIERVERLIKPKVDELKARISNLKAAAKKIQDWEVDKKNANIRLRHYLQFELEYWEKKYLTFVAIRNADTSNKEIANEMLSYGKKKDPNFKISEWKDQWKNSQLVDTQIITKYARAYMKSLFHLVDVQKADINNEFKKIFGFPEKYWTSIESKKDRSRHIHHAIDAMALTLIPGSAKRETVLKLWYEKEELEISLKNEKDEQKRKLQSDRFEQVNKELTKELSVLNLSGKINNAINEIENNILINHISRDKALLPTRKKVRKRGKPEPLRDKNEKGKIIYETDDEGNPLPLKDKKGNIIYKRDLKGEFILDKDGKKIPVFEKKYKWMQGDSIRGQLHKETFLGAIKVVERNEDGFARKENGKYVIRKNKKGEDEIWIVTRKPINKLNIENDVVVDELLGKSIRDQVEIKNKKLNEVVDCQGKRIRHIRCRYKAGKGYLTREKTIELKHHSHESKHEHKKFVLAQNEENYLYLLYEKESNKKVEREARIITLFDFTKYKFSSVNAIRHNNNFNNNEKCFPLKYILKVGQKAIFYSESKEELKKLESKELYKRIFKIYKFNEIGNPYLYLQNHIEARSEEELGELENKKDGYTEFDKNKYQYRLKLVADRLNCVFEGKDFVMKPDGKIIWKF